MANIPPIDEKMVVAMVEPVAVVLGSVDDSGVGGTVGAEGKVTVIVLQPVELQHMTLECARSNFQPGGNASNSLFIVSFAAFRSVLEREQSKIPNI